MEDPGFIMLSRKIFRSAFWNEDREYSRFEAWLDLIAMASYDEHQTFVQGRCLSLRKGDLAASVRYLADRWRWHRSRVERFLTHLEERQQIETRTESGTGIITLCNFARYNTPRDTNRDSRETPTETVARQSRDSRETNNKKERSEEGKELIPPSPPRGEREQAKPARAPATRQDLDEEWILSLVANPTYAGIDVRRELGKARAWAETRKKQCTRRFFVNWLNRADTPLLGPAPTTSIHPKRQHDSI